MKVHLDTDFGGDIDDLCALHQSDPLGALIARQAQAFAEDEQMESRFGAIYPALPPDLINFQHDPLAVAAALGWEEGLKIEELPLLIEEREGLLCETIDPVRGKPVRVVTQVDGARFNQFWLDTVTNRDEFRRQNGVRCEPGSQNP
jgi:hypothetical protein